MAEIGNHAGNEPRPSLEWASWIFDRASFVLIGSLVIGAAATVAMVWMGIVKEHHWDLAREAAARQIAGLNNETEKLRADNLALQTVLLPRHVGLLGINETPKAREWFAGFERFAGTKLLIQVIPGDPEAQNLANEIVIVVSQFGWRVEMIDERRSKISLNLAEGLIVMSPSSYKAWIPNDPKLQLFSRLREAARALATALTRAGLGVGEYPVSGTNGLSIVIDFPPDSDAAKSGSGSKFEPQLDGVYLQVGSRPVTSTVAWIKQGRPDALGNRPASAAPAPNR